MLRLSEHCPESLFAAPSLRWQLAHTTSHFRISSKMLGQLREDNPRPIESNLSLPWRNRTYVRILLGRNCRRLVPLMERVAAAHSAGGGPVARSRAALLPELPGPIHGVAEFRL